MDCRLGNLALGNSCTDGRNGRFVLQVSGRPTHLPCNAGIRQKSQTIRFKTAAERLDIFGMHHGGKEYRRLVAAFERIFGATMFFGTDSVATGAKVVQRFRFNFLSEAQIWYNRDPDDRAFGERFENVISVEYSRPRRFRAMLEQWLTTVCTIWPACPAKISVDGERVTIVQAQAALPSRNPGGGF